MPEPVYIVAGIQRSLTNMTAGAIIAASEGRIRPAYTPERKDRYEAAFDGDGYQFNAGELWELDYCIACSKGRTVEDNAPGEELEVCGRLDCLSTIMDEPERYAGRLYKHNIEGGGFPLPEYPYRVLVLSRDFDEIRYSTGRAMGYDIAERIPRPWANAYVQSFLSAAPQPKRNHWARNLVEPDLKLREWTIVAGDGWPIDPQIAAEYCKWEKVHYRKEMLDLSVPPAHSGVPATPERVALLARSIGASDV